MKDSIGPKNMDNIMRNNILVYSLNFIREISRKLSILLSHDKPTNRDIIDVKDVKENLKNDELEAIRQQLCADDSILPILMDQKKSSRRLEMLGIGQTNWAKTLDEVNRRRIIFEHHRKRLEDIKFAKNEIAAVDIFVEKAQHFLELESRQYALIAMLTSTLITIILLYDYYYLVETATIQNFFITLAKTPNPLTLDIYLFLMWTLRGSALSAISGAAVYFLASLTRAFLHEATVYWNRRHAVRLGRLFIYLKFAGLDEKELPSVRDSLKIEDIERAFGWNLETGTAFKDIRPELMAPKSVPGDPSKIIESLVGIIKDYKTELGNREKNTLKSSDELAQ